jgi:hypothetical protein
LVEESSTSLVEMPVCRLQWSGYATDEAKALVLVLDEELEILEMVEEPGVGL